MTSFTAQIDAWVAKTKDRQTAVFRQSAQEVIEIITRTAPVDTGFLRASLQVGINKPLPVADRTNPGGTYGQPAYTMALAGAVIGDYITAGYTANYARALEFGTSSIAPRGWVRAAAMQWPQIVTRVTAQAKTGR